MTQVTQPETETLAKITGNDPGDFAIVFSSDNNGFYYNSRKEDKQYRFVKNENGNYTIEERHPVEINGKMYASAWEPVKAEKKPQVLPGVEDKSPLGGVPLFGHKVINGMTEEEYQNWTNRFKGQN